MLKELIFHTALIATAGLITVSATLFQQVEIRQHSDLNAIACGWPLKFVVIDQSGIDPPVLYDVRCFFTGGLEYPDQHNLLFFTLDVTFFYVLLLGALGVLALARSTISRELRSFQNSWYEIMTYANIILWIFFAGILLIILAFMLMMVTSPSPKIEIIPMQ